MPRKATGWWNPVRRLYEARLGPPDENGRKTIVVLRDDEGNPLPYLGDEPAKIPAVREAVERATKECGRSKPVSLTDGLTVASLCRLYLMWHADHKSKPRTIRSHKEQLTIFCKFRHQGISYGDRPASGIKVEDLARFRKAEEKRGMATGTLRLRYESILACWRWAARPVEDRIPVRLLSDNPFLELKRPKRGPVVDKVVESDVARRFVRFAHRLAFRTRWSREADHDHSRLFCLALRLIRMCGVRPQEMLGLEWSEIDWRRGVAELKDHKTAGSTGRSRIYSIPARGMKALAWLKKHERRHRIYVFDHYRTQKTKAPDAHDFARWLRKVRSAAIEAGIPIPNNLTAYWFRHTWQTVGLETESVEGVAAAAGNSPKVLLENYNHPRIQRIKQVADAVDRKLREKPDQ